MLLGWYCDHKMSEIFKTITYNSWTNKFLEYVLRSKPHNKNLILTSRFGFEVENTWYLD